MNNHVEILRALVFYKEDYETITNLDEIEKSFGPDFNRDKELPLMEEFKKIYELGSDQLEKFIKLLHDNGPDVDEYTILYYIDLLLNGPLGSMVKDLTKDENRYWPKTPDSLGNNGNVTRSTANIVMYEQVGYPLGCAVDTYNRLPAFMQTTFNDSIKITEDSFRNGMTSSTIVDNTLPMVDKAQAERYEEEPEGIWVSNPHGTMLVKDSWFYLTIKNSSEQIFDKVKEYLKGKDDKDETYRLYKAKKQFTAFDSDKNSSTSNILKVEKEFTDGENSEIISLDVMGDEFDSFERRNTVLKVTNPIKDEEFKLNTNQGALGN